MGILYSNIPLTKETPQETILNIVIAENDSVSILDKTSEVYKNKTKLIRNFNFVKKPFNEYQIQLLPFVKNDGLVVGLYQAEGYDFKISYTKEPIVLINKNNVDLTLKGFFDSSKNVSKVVIGMFFPGTKIRYKLNGVSYIDELTTDGWKSKRHQESVSDVAEKARQQKELTKEEKVKLAEELMKAGEISKDLFTRYKISQLGFESYEKQPKNAKILLNALTLEEVKLLKSKGL